MRTKPVDLLRDFQALVADLLEQVPKTKSTDLRVRAQSLKQRTDELLRDGRGSHWQLRRNNQLFEITVRGQGSHLIKGVDATAAELGWKVTTLRSRLSDGHGTVSFERETDAGAEVVTVTKLKTTDSER